MKTARAVQRLKAAFVGAAILGLAVYPAGNANGSTKSTLVLVQSIAPTSMNPNIDKIRANVRVQNQVIETGSEYQYIKGAYALVPTLVTGWKQSGLNGWIFKVRPGVQFSNGEKLTSAAFKFTLDAYRAYTGGKLAAFFKDWTIQVIDPLSFKVITTLPNDTSVPGLMTQFFVYPPKYFAEVGAVAYGEKPIGTGPYKLKQLKAGSEVDLVANAKYWGQKATIKNVTVRAVPDDATRVSALLAGQADIAEGVAQPLISRVSASKNYGIRSVQTGNVFFLMINMNLPPFDNVLVRQALNYSIDRSSLATYLFKQTAKPSTQWYAPFYPGINKNYNPYPYDRAKAKALLAQAGYPKGIDVDFYFPVGSNAMDQQSAEVIQFQLQQAGFRVQMHAGDPNSVRNTFSLGTESGFFLNSYSPPSLDVSSLFAYYLKAGTNYSKTAVSPTAAALVAQAAGTVNPKKRYKLYNDAQSIFLGNEALFAPLWTLVDTWGVAKNVVFTPDPFQQYHMNKMSFK